MEDPNDQFSMEDADLPMEEESNQIHTQDGGALNPAEDNINAIIKEDHLEGVDDNTQEFTKYNREREQKCYRKIVKQMDISDAQTRESDNIQLSALITFPPFNFTT